MSTVAAPVTVGVVDYGMGNRRSVEKALQRVGARALVSDDPRELRAADGLVVPGVGAFPVAMRSLRDRGLDDLILERTAAGTPVLGICLGLQLLFESSSEGEPTPGLGLVPGRVVRLSDAGGRRMPHIGWNDVAWRAASPLLDGLGERAAFYHVHSYAPRPEAKDDVLGTADYGEPFVSAVQRGTVFGVQFHPEKSAHAGLRLLRNFAALCARVAAAAPA